MCGEPALDAPSSLTALSPRAGILSSCSYIFHSHHRSFHFLAFYARVGRIVYIMDADSLSQTQKDALAQLQALMDGGDEDVAMGVLQSVDWDVQVCLPLLVYFSALTTVAIRERRVCVCVHGTTCVRTAHSYERHMHVRRLPRHAFVETCLCAAI